jgi:putative membrane protein
MRNTLLLAPVALLAVAACNNRSETETADTGMDTTMPADDTSTDAPMAVTAADYVSMAAISDMYEIESSRLAQEKGQSDEVKAHARRMIGDHTRTSDALKAAVADMGSGMQVPTRLDARHQQMIDELRAAEGAAFDRLYMQQQRMAHDNAYRLHSGYAANGDNPDLKTVASNAVPIIERHRAMFEGSGGMAGGMGATGSGNGMAPATASGNTAGSGNSGTGGTRTGTTSGGSTSGGMSSGGSTSGGSTSGGTSTGG